MARTRVLPWRPRRPSLLPATRIKNKASEGDTDISVIRRAEVTQDQDGCDGWVVIGKVMDGRKFMPDI